MINNIIGVTIIASDSENSISEYLSFIKNTFLVH